MFRIAVDSRRGQDPFNEAMQRLERELTPPKGLDFVEELRWRHRQINKICAETAENERLTTRPTDAERKASRTEGEGEPMPKHPFEALQDHHLKWVAQGIGVDHGTFVAESQIPFLHPGDNAGRVAAVAFEKYGPDIAADVLRSYRTAYNRAIMAWNASQGASDAIEMPSCGQLRETCGLALSVRLSSDQIDAVKKSLGQTTNAQ